MNRDRAIELLRGGEQGVAEWNSWRRERSREEIPDLGGADLSELNLSGALLNVTNLRGADLSGTDLSDASLVGSNFSSADLSNTRLYGAYLNSDFVAANLSSADLRTCTFQSVRLQKADLSDTWASASAFFDCDLTNADFSNADLSQAYFSGSTLRKTNFKRARFWGTAIDSDLSDAVGLASVKHDGPSVLSIGTLQACKKPLPLRFLRGCGVDPQLPGILKGDYESLVEAAYSADHRPISLQKCFISYSNNDRRFVDRLQKALNDTGVDYWYAPEHAVAGRGLREQIDREITIRDRTILVCSNSSLNDSDWCKYELEKTINDEDARQRDGAANWRKVFPIVIDDTLFEWEHYLRPRLLEVLVADFRGATKGKAFSRAFAKLLEGLGHETTETQGRASNQSMHPTGNGGQRSG